MKTNKLIQTFAAVIAVGIALPAMAATNSSKETASKQISSDASSTSDAPEVKYLFRHTAENPYDIRVLSWYGGLATRVQIVPKTDKTIVVAYNTGDLRGAKITGKAPSRIGFKMCKNGKTTVLFDILCLEKRDNILPNLVTRMSDVNEWRVALDQQDHGQLNVKNFARSSTVGEQYASR